MVGLIKQSLFKATGYANINLNELEEILLYIEINLNNRPLTYFKDDVAFPVLTPSRLIFGNPQPYLKKTMQKMTETQR